MAHDPLREACWRFEQISPLLDSRLTGAERRQMIRDISGVCTVPSSHPAGNFMTFASGLRQQGIERSQR